MSERNLMKSLRKIAEHKQYGGLFEFGADPAYYATYIDSPGRNLLMTAVPQGIQGDDRIGDKLTGTSLRIKLMVSPDQAYTGNRNTEHWLRIIVYIWKDDTSPVMSDLLQNYVAAPAGLWPFEAYDPDKKVKSKILLDTVIGQRASKSSSGIDLSLGANVPAFREWKFNLTKLRRGLNVINYQQGSATVAINHIYMLLKSNIPVLSQSSAWDIAVSSDFRYIDM